MTETLIIESMAYLGAGVTHTVEGKVMFVDGAVVGDVIKVLEVQSLPKHDKCLSFEIVKPSPERVSAPCRYADECGGCPWQILSYPEQLRQKRRFVVDALERIGKVVDAEKLVANCVPAPFQWHYRNKVEFDAFIQGGKLRLGLHKRDSHEHVALEECLLLPKNRTGLPAHLAGALNYSLKEAQSELLRVAIRSSFATGFSELALYMKPCGVNRSLLVKTLNNNREFDSLVRVIVSGDMAERKVKKVEVLAGPGHWQEELIENHFKISAPSFFQTNSLVAGLMIGQLGRYLDELDLFEFMPVVDLYSGAGTFTLPLAERFSKVTAIESFGSSIRDLRRNLDEAGLSDRVEVIGGDVARELNTLRQKSGRPGAVVPTIGRHENGRPGAVVPTIGRHENGRPGAVVPTIGRHENGRPGAVVPTIGGQENHLPVSSLFSLAIVDPPRSGLSPEARTALLEAGIPHLVYISCNPTTLARDIAYLAQDYKLLAATPFDQFPQSYHVEIMALLQRQ